MKVIMACFILGSLFGLIPPSLPAQQNQSPQYSAQEFEILKNRVSELEKQLQTVENVEKMELQAELAEARAELLNAEFGKFERELRDSNDKWLRTWSHWFLGIIGFFALTLLGVSAVFWYWLKSRADRLIADQIEKNLNGFKESLKESGILKNQLADLEEAVVVTLLERTFEPDQGSEIGYPRENKARRNEILKGLREEPLLKVSRNEKYHLALRHRAADILAMKSPPLISPLLEFLNSMVVDMISELDSQTEQRLRNSVHILGQINTQETYEGLRKFLTRLLTENPKHKRLFLTWTVFALGWVSVKLHKKDSVTILKAAIAHLEDLQLEHGALIDLAGHFDILDAPECLKQMLTVHKEKLPSDVKEKCLALLDKHDLEFVENWRAENTTDDTDSA